VTNQFPRVPNMARGFAVPVLSTAAWRSGGPCAGQPVLTSGASSPSAVQSERDRNNADSPRSLSGGAAGSRGAIALGPRRLGRPRSSWRGRPSHRSREGKGCRTRSAACSSRRRRSIASLVRATPLRIRTCLWSPCSRGERLGCGEAGGRHRARGGGLAGRGRIIAQHHAGA
jgi:hypothetical protein